MDAFRRCTIQQAHQRHMAELAYWVSSLHWQRRQLIDEEFQINKGQPEKMRERTRVSSKAIFGFVASLKDWCKRIAACLWTRATGSLANVTRQLLFTRKERMKQKKGQAIKQQRESTRNCRPQWNRNRNWNHISHHSIQQGSFCLRQPIRITTSDG